MNMLGIHVAIASVMKFPLRAKAPVGLSNNTNRGEFVTKLLPTMRLVELKERKERETG